MATLEVRNFAQIEYAHVEFGDLTVLVGPQATGKSLLLQWLKVGLDIGEIIHALKEAGHDVKDRKNLLDLIFGAGMSEAWIDGQTTVRLNQREVSPARWLKGAKNNPGKVFFIPAHRALLLAEGWPAPFQRLNADTPVVARLFSQHLYQRFSGRQASALFPQEGLLKRDYRELITQAVFHGGQVDLEKDRLQYRLRLAYGDRVKLPFMTWTAGQREFTPLLLGLYHALRPRRQQKVGDVDWVVIEEPEMGLHPKAIAVVMLLVLELMWRGYKVVVSTHSPLVLEAVWAIRQLAAHQARWQLLAEAFDVGNKAGVRKVMEDALKRDYRVFFLKLDAQSHRVMSQDISDLDPESENENEASLGGLTGFSTSFGEAVRKAVQESEQA